ncbi:MAG: response regulator transcription factor [Geobacteraceae bacterium]|nr:response regulator transcription factor [Geobacteraceae bacterium]
MREDQILAAMVEGLNNKQIAEKLGVSLSTVKSHASNIFFKLCITNRTEAVPIAFRNHIIS